ncbi:MAG: hypothetical protein ACOYBE_04905 [Blautia sp.]|jgi:hypothetical protein
MGQNKDNLLPTPKGHLDEEMIQKHLQRLHTADHSSTDLDFLEHIGTCNYCAERLAHQLETEGLLCAPKDFKENVIAQTKSLRTQTELAIHKTSAKMQLLFYSLRVGAAILGALVILFLSSAALSLHSGQMPSTDLPKPPTQRQENFSFSKKLDEGSRYLNEILQDFSDKLIHMEGSNND